MIMPNTVVKVIKVKEPNTAWSSDPQADQHCLLAVRIEP
jgi:hypothetical protein